jgi:hypothetical protein
MNVNDLSAVYDTYITPAQVIAAMVHATDEDFCEN